MHVFVDTPRVEIQDAPTPVPIINIFKVSVIRKSCILQQIQSMHLEYLSYSIIPTDNGATYIQSELKEVPTNPMSISVQYCAMTSKKN